MLIKDLGLDDWRFKGIVGVFIAVYNIPDAPRWRGYGFGLTLVADDWFDIKLG